MKVLEKKTLAPFVAALAVASTALAAPAAPAEPKFPDDEYRKSPPQAGQEPALKIPEVKTFTDQTTGLQVYLVERRDLPMVSWQLAFDTGSAFDPKGKEGLAALSMALLQEGTKRLDKVAFEAKQADLASSLSAWGGLETSGASFRSLSRNADETLALFVEMLREPGLRQADLDRLKKKMKADLAQQKAAPASIAARLSGAVVYGADHPYGRVLTEESLDAVTLDDVRAFLSRLGPQGARLYVTGDMGQAQVQAALSSKLASWKGEAPKPAKVGKAAPMKGTIFFVDVPGAPQSQIVLGDQGPARTASDYEATLLMSQILGGGFSSRLNMNLREKNGFTYGARAGFTYRRAGGSFGASTLVRTDATGKALREIAREISGMRGKAPEAAEITRERQGLVLGLPAQFSTGDRIQSTIGELVFFGLPLDWHAGFKSRLEAVDAAKIHDAAKKHLGDGSVKVLVVGDGKTVLPELQAIAKEGLFGKDGLVVLDADGAVVKR